MRMRGYFQFANLREHYICFHKASFKCILTGEIPLKQWTMKISQFASKIASKQSVKQLHYEHFKQFDQTLLSDFGSLHQFQLISSLWGEVMTQASCDQVMQVWVSRGEERRIRAGPSPELTPGPARPHSTCYSMAGSTWSKNTNFHAFMASKKSNFQIIFNITCSYWAARSSQNVLQVSNRHWETIYDTDSEQRFRENDSILGILRILFDVKQGSQDSEDNPINGTRTLERRRGHVGANWSLVWKEFLWANLRILFTACKHCRDLET